MLYADTDLSQCSLSYEVPSSCTSLFSPGPSPDLEAGKSHEADDEELAFENQAAIRAFWGSSLTMLDGVADHARIFDAIDTDHSGDISIDELRTALHRADETATEADVQQCFEALDADHDGRITKDEFVTSPPRRQGMEAELGKLDRLNSHVLLHPEAGLIQCIMRQTAERAGVSEQLQAGNVPCPLVAMHIVITCSDVSSYSKTRYRLLVVLPMLVTLAFFFTVLYAHLVCLCLRPCRARARARALSLSLGSTLRPLLCSRDGAVTPLRVVLALTLAPVAVLPSGSTHPRGAWASSLRRHSPAKALLCAAGTAGDLVERAHGRVSHERLPVAVPAVTHGATASRPRRCPPRDRGPLERGLGG